MVAVAALIGACGGDDGPSDQELRDALVDGGFEPAVARCYVGEMSDRWTNDEKQAVINVDLEYEFTTDSAAADEKCFGGDMEFEEVGEGL